MNAVEIPPPLIQRLRQAQRVCVLTGAGVSAESGVPTFRAAQTGLWSRYDPQELATPNAFRRNPQLVWNWYRWRRGLISQARPNPAHWALAALEKLVPDFTLVTQNVDGLHQQAGSQKIIELHGNIHVNRCSRCGQISEQPDTAQETLPKCTSCTALLRPDVVWFGETLPPQELNRAIQAAASCDMFFSVGTSGLVEPAASLPFLAQHTGAVVEVNPEPTPLTAQADFVLPGAAGLVLPALLQAAWPDAPVLSD